MPRLVCRSCGRQIYTTAPLEALYGEERRCPRCGAGLNGERREVDRREMIRRQNTFHEPGPPNGERRLLDDRRLVRRRKATDGSARTVPWTPDELRWRD